MPIRPKKSTIFNGSSQHFGPCAAACLRRRLTDVSRQPVVNVGCGDCSMTESHTQLMQICHDIPCGVKTFYCRLLMAIDNEIAVLGAQSSEFCRKVRTNATTESWIKSIHLMLLSAFRHKTDSASCRSSDLSHPFNNPYVCFLKFLSELGTRSRTVGQKKG